MTIKIEALTVGPLEVNCYVVGCDKHNLGAVIDPGDSAKRILAIIKDNGWKLTHIINTHAHFDHVGANGKVKEATGARIILHKSDLPVLTSRHTIDMANYMGVDISPDPDDFMRDGETIEICPCIRFEVLHTPGHSPGGVCLLLGDALFSGDTLFRLSIGRSDIPGGSMDTLMVSIKTKLFPLPNELKVYPGHGEETTIGFEKANNPFLTGAFL